MAGEEIVIPENARAVCGKELPTVRTEHINDGTILLFYQYIEDPIWSKAEHKAALKKVIEIGTKYNITGRGRVAREGLNCTLTGKPHDIRSFCYGLREWNDVFNDTDFKVTDGIALDKMFKSLSIRKTNELVAYGLAGGKFKVCLDADSLLRLE
jgi:predicted sulfurtransferase